LEKLLELKKNLPQASHRSSDGVVIQERTVLSNHTFSRNHHHCNRCA
jgi:hypothetical protein